MSAQSSPSGPTLVVGSHYPLSEDVLETVLSSSTAAKEMSQRHAIVLSRSVLLVEEQHAANSLTTSTLAGPGMISEKPYVFADNIAGSLLAFYHLGQRLAGHAGLVHGGILAVLLDECMGRACFPRLVGRIAVTAQLDIAFKAPVKVNSVISIRADTIEVQGRKAWVDAVVEDAQEGTIIATASALFVEPKWASEMSKLL